MSTFRDKHSFEERKKEAEVILAKYPCRIPVIVERAQQESNLPEISKYKYLVPNDMTVSNLLFVLRKKMKLESSKALFLFVNGNTMVPTSGILSEIYQKHADLDSYLYISYCSENVFG